MGTTIRRPKNVKLDRAHLEVKILELIEMWLRLRGPVQVEDILTQEEVANNLQGDPEFVKYVFGVAGAQGFGILRQYRNRSWVIYPNK